MAIDPKSMTVDYRTLQSIPFRDRRALLYSSYADQVNAALTPSQRANLFPSYYQKDAEAARSAMTGITNLNKAEYLNKERNNAGVNYYDANKANGNLANKAPPEPTLTASQFRAVEGTMLAGSVDVAKRKKIVQSNLSGSAREKAEKYLGRKMSDNEYDYLIRATHAEAAAGKNANPKEQAMIMASILNRARSRGEEGVIVALKEKNQFQAVTGTKYNPGPSKNFSDGPSKERLSSIEGSTNLLAVIPTEQKDFTAASAAAYGPGTNIKYRDDMIRNGGQVIGGSVFNTNPDFESIDVNEVNEVKEQKIDQKNATSPDALAIVQEVASQTVSASEIRDQEYESLGKFEHADSSEQFGVTGTAAARGLSEVDPRLVDIMKKTAEEFPLRTRLFSGKRDKGGHGAGVATDIQLFDEDGKPIGSYQTPQSANIYAMYALKAREVQMRDYPELKDSFTWLGGLGGMTEGGGGKYGAADWMDFRIGHTPQSAMVAFKWPDPDKPGSGGWQKGYEHYTEGDFTGIGHNMPQAEDFKKLEGLVLTPEQEYQQRYVAKRIGANAGLLAQPNIGKRRKEDPVYVEAKPTSVPSEKITVISSAEESSPSATISTPDQRRQELGIDEDVTGTGLVTTSQDPEVYKKESRASALGNASAPTTTEQPQSQTTPIKTMAQGGIVPSYGESEIVTRAPTSGEVIQRTKISEYGAEQVKVEPISKMKAEALTPVKNDLDVAPQMNEDQQKLPMQKASMTASRISNRPYSNIMSEVKKPTATALRAALQIRMGNTAMGDYVA